MEAFAVILILIMIIVALIAFAVMQIKMAGMEVKDFWTFIKANDDLDKLYVFSKHYSRMSPQEKIIFLHEAEKVSDAFEKIPSMIWEDENKNNRDIIYIKRNIKIQNNIIVKIL